MHKLAGGRRAEFFHQFGAVHLYRARAQVNLTRNQLTGFAFNNQRGDFAFAWRQFGRYRTART
jgi:hypothetical protein